jgi:hypothetical protein
MVLDSVASAHSKRNYAKALDNLFAFCASRSSAVRKMVGEARHAGMIGQEEVATLTDVPNISQRGTRLGTG